jgi:hypothetical protein
MVFLSNKTELVNLLKKFCSEAHQIIFPSFCISCNSRLNQTEKKLCSLCLHQIFELLDTKQKIMILESFGPYQKRLCARLKNLEDHHEIIEAIFLLILFELKVAEETVVLIDDCRFFKMKHLAALYPVVLLTPNTVIKECDVIFLGLYVKQECIDYLKLSFPKRLEFLFLFFEKNLFNK